MYEGHWGTARKIWHAVALGKELGMKEFWAPLLLSPLTENPANNEAKDKTHHQMWREDSRIPEGNRHMELPHYCLEPASHPPGPTEGSTIS